MIMDKTAVRDLVAAEEVSEVPDLAMSAAEIRATYASLIQPPMSEWARAFSCVSWKRQELQHGPLIAVRTLPGSMTVRREVPGGWVLDRVWFWDLLRQSVGIPMEVPSEKPEGLHWSGFGAWNTTQIANLPRIVEYLTQAGAVDRLRVRELTDPAGCTHRLCRALASSSSSEMEASA